MFYEINIYYNGNIPLYYYYYTFSRYTFEFRTLRSEPTEGNTRQSRSSRHLILSAGS